MKVDIEPDLIKYVFLLMEKLAEKNILSDEDIADISKKACKKDSIK